MKELIKKYRHAWVFSYILLYFAWFTFLEKHVDETFYAIHIRLDDVIPFCEWFIFPYLIWFPFVAVAVLYFFFHNKSEFYRICAFVFGGMTVCLLIYTIWPNGQVLRPDLALLGRENLATQLVSMIYRADTPTNVCPSIHVFNSLAVCIAVYRSPDFTENKLVRYTTLILTILICLSTVFLKQHSAFDGICAAILALVFTKLVYSPRHSFVKEDKRQTT